MRVLWLVSKKVFEMKSLSKQLSNSRFRNACEFLTFFFSHFLISHQVYFTNLILIAHFVDFNESNFIISIKNWFWNMILLRCDRINSQSNNYCFWTIWTRRCWILLNWKLNVEKNVKKKNVKNSQAFRNREKNDDNQRLRTSHACCLLFCWLVARRESECLKLQSFQHFLALAVSCSFRKFEWIEPVGQSPETRLRAPAATSKTEDTYITSDHVISWRQDYSSLNRDPPIRFSHPSLS